MRTSVVLPSGWEYAEQRGDGYAQLVREDAGLLVELTPLQLRTEDDAAFVHAAVLGSADPAVLRVGDRSAERSAAGWPMQVIEAAVFEGNELVEGRVVFILELVQYLAAIRVRARPAASLTTYHGDIMAIVDSARPDWTSDEVIALDQLWR